MSLSSRWTTREGNDLTQRILNLLRKGMSSDVAQIAGKHERRSDLRGFSFPKPKRTGQSIELSGYKVELISDATEFEGVVSEDIDFSDADMRESVWRRCSFSNCKFDHSRLDDAAFFDCRISRCGFVNSNLTGCVLGGHIRNHSGELTDSIFKDGAFKDVVFAFPRIERCRFDCNITNVDFNGSQLTDCWFTGKLDKVIFRKRPGESVTDKAMWARLIPENRMENVDFSEAGLYDVDFWNGVDTKNADFPENTACSWSLMVFQFLLKRKRKSNRHGKARREESVSVSRSTTIWTGSRAARDTS